MPSQVDVPFLVIPETKKEVHQGGLPCTAGPHHGQFSPVRQVKGHITQRGRVLWIIAEGHVFHTDAVIVGDGRRPLGIPYRGLGIHNFEKASGRGKAAFQVLEDARQGHDGLETGHDGHDDYGQIHPVHPSCVHQGDGHGQRRGHGHVNHEGGKPHLQPGDAGHARLQAIPFLAEGTHPLTVGLLLTVRQKVGLPLNAVHQSRVQFGAHRYHAGPQRATEVPGQQRNSDAGQDHDQAEHQGQFQGVGEENPPHEHQGHDRDDRRGQHADVEVLQTLHIRDDASQEIAAPKLGETGRRQGFQGLVEPNPQTGQQAEGHIVRGQTLRVTEEAARDAEEAHHRDGHVKHRDGGVQGRTGDDVRGRSQQPDTAGNGRHAQRRGQSHPPREGPHKPHQTPEGRLCRLW